jgi:hypothetical protein
MIIGTSAGGSGSGGLFLQAGAGAMLRTFQNKDRDLVSARDFAAAGNNVAVDTAPYLLALNSGLPDITPESVTGYKVGALAVPASIKSITGQRLYQSAAGANGYTIANATGLRLSLLDLFGVANGGVYANNNDALSILNSSDIRVDGAYSTGWNGCAIRSNGVTNSNY